MGEEGQVLSGESVPVTRSSRCEGPEVGMCLVCLRKKGDRVTGVERVRGKSSWNEARDILGTQMMKGFVSQCKDFGF